MNQTDINTPHNSTIHFNSDSLVIHREEGFLSIGDCDIGAGFTKVQNIIAYYHDGSSDDVLTFSDDLKSIMDKNNLKGSYCAIKTSVKLDNSVLISKGMVSTISIPEKEFLLKKISENLLIIKQTPDTEDRLIDNIIIINQFLDEKALIKCFKAAIEAKTQALNSLGLYQSPKTNQINSESLIIASLGSPISDEEASLLEILNDIDSCIKESIPQTLHKAGFSQGILDYIHQVGVTVEDLVEAGMALCVGVEVTSALQEKLRGQILKSLEDINVMALIMAAIRVEEDFSGHRLREVDVDDDPAYLYTDEVLGMAIANQIAGTKAIFNFKRYDEEKPGIISTLGPMLDDIFAGLVAGCMSKIFEE